jgi:lia operon protein LiaF
MKNKGELVLGISILVIGGVLLVGNLAQINVWRFFWPLLLIGLGVLILIRQQSAQKLGTRAIFSFSKDIKRRDVWEISDAEYWHFAGDFKLDLTAAVLSEKTHLWQIFGFVHEIRLKVPENLGVAINANAIVIENKILGENEDRILNPLSWKSPNYETAPKQFHIEMYGIVCDVKVSLIEGESDEIS